MDRLLDQFVEESLSLIFTVDKVGSLLHLLRPLLRLNVEESGVGQAPDEQSLIAISDQVQERIDIVDSEKLQVQKLSLLQLSELQQR